MRQKKGNYFKVYSRWKIFSVKEEVEVVTSELDSLERVKIVNCIIFLKTNSLTKL